MPRLADISKNKYTILSRILEHEGLKKALYYTDRDFLDKPDVEDSQLLNKHIFPYPITLDETTEVGTFLTMQNKEFRLTQSSYKTGTIAINVFCHKDVIETDYAPLRYDFIVSEIDKLLNQQRGVGMGKLTFHELEEINVDHGFLGQSITYRLYEFN